MKSTSTRYGSVAVTIHWLSAGFILALLASGFRAASLVDGTAKTALLSLHVPLGMIILVLTVMRILWWLIADRKPDASTDSSALQAFTARIVHFLLYVFILVLGGSGTAMMIQSGAGDILFGASEAALPDFQKLAPRMPHGFAARAAIALTVLHVGAALYHHFIKQDGLLWRMWYGKRIA